MHKEETAEQFKLREKVLAYLRYTNKVNSDKLKEGMDGLDLINDFLLFCNETHLKITLLPDGTIVNIE